MREALHREEVGEMGERSDLDPCTGYEGEKEAVQTPQAEPVVPRVLETRPPVVQQTRMGMLTTAELEAVRKTQEAQRRIEALDEREALLASGELVPDRMLQEFNLEGWEVALVEDTDEIKVRLWASDGEPTEIEMDRWLDYVELLARRVGYAVHWTTKKSL